MLFSNRDLTRIILPLVIESVLAVTIGMLDTVMVSRVGEAAVSGVSLVDSINLFMVYAFSALSSGGAVIISQILGTKDKEYAKKALKQLLWIVFLLSFTLMAAMLIFRKSLLSLIFGSIDKEVMKNAQVYFLYTAMSYPFLGLYNVGAATFNAMGKSKISMKVSIGMNLINLVGNAILIYGFDMGAAGAAIATLFSRIVGAAIMMTLIHNRHNSVYIEDIFNYKPDFYLIKRICGIGIPNGAENSMFQFGKIITQSLISTFGTAQIAANAVTHTLITFQYCPGTALGSAMLIVVGRCMGAGEKEQAKKYAGKLLGIAYGILATISILMIIFSKPLVGFFNLSGEAGSIAIKLLIIHSAIAMIVHPTAFCLVNTFRAASDVKYSFTVSTASMWICRVALSYVFGKYMGLGVMGVWFAMFCDWIVRAGFFGIHLLRGKWLDKYKPFENSEKAEA